LKDLCKAARHPYKENKYDKPIEPKVRKENWQNTGCGHNRPCRGHGNDREHHSDLSNGLRELCFQL